MGERLRPFIPRAYRYTLSQGDDRKMRFAFPGSSESHQGELLNISESGLGFLVDSEHKADEGKNIKVEIYVPNHGRIAWWAKITRSVPFEPRSWWQKRAYQMDQRHVIGVAFSDLPESLQTSIQAGIRTSIEEQKRFERNQKYHAFIDLLNEQRWNLVAIFLTAAITYSVISYLSTPSANYNSERGAPWGQRFKSIQLFNE